MKIKDKIKIITQKVLPKKFLSNVIAGIAETKIKLVKNLLIKSAISIFKINMDEALTRDLSKYKTFNDFFTRQLKNGVRPIDERANSICSPADGVITEYGQIQSSQLIQAKKIKYTLDHLLNHSEMASRYQNGDFFTIYLSPKDYHRVHMPMDGKLISHQFIPGELFSVDHTSVSNIPSLFCRNERLICEFFSEKVGHFSVIFVGAFLVSGIDTVWKREHNFETKTHQRVELEGHSLQFKKGQEIGRFRYGSTVILLFQKNKISRVKKISKYASSVKVGNRVSTIVNET